MKITLLIITLSSVVSAGAFAQGSVDGITTMFTADSIVTPGPDATDPNNPNANYFSGTVTLALYYAATGSVTPAEINAVNALDGITGGGAGAEALLSADGFQEVSVPAVTGDVVGAGTYTVTAGHISGGSDEMGLYGVPTDGSGWLAVVITAVGESGTGVLAFDQANLGGNPNGPVFPYNPAKIVQDPDGLNLVLEVPEPGTAALAALGGASLLLFRGRRPASRGLRG